MANFNNGNITGDVKVSGKILGTIYARSNSYLNPLLCSNPDRTGDSSGDTWIFSDSKAPDTNKYGIFHNQASNFLEFWGANTRKAYFDLASGILSTNNGKSVLRYNSLGEEYTNGNASIDINRYGYQGGVTQFRDFAVYDGKGATLASFIGSTKAVTLYGTLTVPGVVNANGGLSQDGNVILNGSDTWLRTTGATGWYSETYQGGWYMTDASWVRSYIDKSVATGGEIRSNAGFSNVEGKIGTNAANAKNHFTQTNASTSDSSGWIAGAFGKVEAPRVVIGQMNSKAVLGAHTGNLDNWANLHINPDVGNVVVGLTPTAACLRTEKFQVFGTGYFNNTVSTTGLTRTSHSTGHLIGSYNNVGPNDTKTNPIYTIGSAYSPTDSSTSNMYGIGYSHSNFWGSGIVDGWGLYVSNAGTIQTILGYGVWTSGDIKTVGSVYANGDVLFDLSDVRLKTEFEPITNALDSLDTLDFGYYYYNDLAKSYGFEKTERQVGTKAQQVKDVMPEAVALAPFDSSNGVSKSGEDYLTVRYEKLVPLLGQAVKDLREEIKKLKKEIEVLK